MVPAGRWINLFYDQMKHEKYKELKIKAEEDQIQKNKEEIRIKEWESKFEEQMRLKEQKEILKAERLARKEREKIGLIEQEKQKLEEELTSRLESFEVKQTKKN